MAVEMEFQLVRGNKLETCVSSEFFICMSFSMSLNPKRNNLIMSVIVW